MFRKYLAGMIPAESENLPLPPVENYREVRAASELEAAMEFLRLFFIEHGKKTGVLNVGVFEANGPRHENGMPIVIDRFELVAYPTKHREREAIDQREVPRCTA